MASPKEVKRTTVIFNETNQHNAKNPRARHSEAIGNLQGYFAQKQAAHKRMSSNPAYHMGVEDEVQTPKANKNEAMAQQPQYTSYTEVKGKPITDSMNEESKQNLNASGFEENDLFTHLTYLS